MTHTAVYFTGHQHITHRHTGYLDHIKSQNHELLQHSLSHSMLMTSKNKIKSSTLMVYCSLLTNN